jgi:hypothetical protein
MGLKQLVGSLVHCRMLLLGRSAVLCGRAGVQTVERPGHCSENRSMLHARLKEGNNRQDRIAGFVEDDVI